MIIQIAFGIVLGAACLIAVQIVLGLICAIFDI